jgi:hypothetical protein
VKRQPKGLVIYRLLGVKVDPFVAVVKGKGRTGAKQRSEFMRLPHGRQQQLMRAWWRASR